MNIQTVFDTINSIETLEQQRRETFEREFDAFDAGKIDTFSETRSVHDQMRSELHELQTLLVEERDELEAFEDGTARFTVEQAVRNRQQIISKVDAHIRYATDYHDAMEDALGALDKNIETIEDDEGALADTQQHLKRARRAIEQQNEAIVGLEKNFSVMNAYLR